jgi:hypothetical protein
MHQIDLEKLQQECWKLLATPEPFRQWLIQQGNNPVGVAHDSCKCPLSTFLTQTFNADIPAKHKFYVGIRHVLISEKHELLSGAIDCIGECTSYSIPSWMVNFINQVDKFGTKEYPVCSLRTGEEWVRFDCPPLPASEVLAVLQHKTGAQQ